MPIVVGTSNGTKDANYCRISKEGEGAHVAAWQRCPWEDSLECNS